VEVPLEAVDLGTDVDQLLDEVLEVDVPGGVIGIDEGQTVLTLL